jgi:hypothetical protein
VNSRVPNHDRRVRNQGPAGRRTLTEYLDALLSALTNIHEDLKKSIERRK